MTGKKSQIVTLKRRVIKERRNSTIKRRVKPRPFSWLFSQLLTSKVPSQEEEISKIYSNVLGYSLSAKDIFFAR